VNGISQMLLLLMQQLIVGVAAVGLESAPRRRRLGHRPLARDKRFPCGTEIRSN